jgi:hypothetical protein
VIVHFDLMARLYCASGSFVKNDDVQTARCRRVRKRKLWVFAKIARDTGK